MRSNELKGNNLILLENDSDDIFYKSLTIHTSKQFENGKETDLSYREDWRINIPNIGSSPFPL